MTENNGVKKKDFVEIKYTGCSNNQVFDSNIEEELKKVNPEAKPQKTIVVVGEGMVVSGFDKALEGKDLGKEYEIELKPAEAFGERKRDLVKTIPLRVFMEKKIDPRPGMSFALDDMIARVIAVSGARVVTDFNNPLAGKIVKYKFKIERKVEDEKEKVETVFNLLFRAIPEYEIKDKIVVKGVKQLEAFINAFKEKFKELIGKELSFEEKKPEKKEDKKETAEKVEEKKEGKKTEGEETKKEEKKKE